MTRIVHVDGRWLPEGEAHVSVFDRGFLFADAVYEVTAVLDGRLVDYAAHAARLRRSLSHLAIPWTMADDALLALHREVVARNGLREGLVYLQISRGAADRDFAFGADLSPTLVLFSQAKVVVANPKAVSGLVTVTRPEARWARRDIKTVQLLYASLMKTEAKAAGADDVLLVEDGFITEASSANVHIVTREGVVVTRDLSRALLPGITRASVLDLAAVAGLAVEQRPFTPEEARGAAECFITSATSFVLPVARIDGTAVGEGRPGPVTRRLRDLYVAERRATAI